MSHLIKRLRTLHLPRHAIIATRAVTFDLCDKYLSHSPKPHSKRIFFLTKYCFHKPPLHATLIQHWLAISSDPTTNKHCPVPPCLTYSNHRHFKSLFSHTPKFTFLKFLPSYHFQTLIYFPLNSSPWDPVYVLINIVIFAVDLIKNFV